MITNLKLEVFKLYVEMFCLLCLYVYFFISAVVVILQTKTILKTKLIFVKLRFLAGKIQRSLKKNFINVSKFP